MRTKEEKEIAFYLYDEIYKLGEENKLMEIKDLISEELTFDAEHDAVIEIILEKLSNNK